ncbi:MAG: RluA family pseudouridine synthase [Pseudomonadota bacterium]
MNIVEQKTVSEDEAGMRLDRWFKAHYPQLSHIQLQKLLRSGQVRADGKRVKADFRIAAGAIVRVPPLQQNEKAAPKKATLVGSPQEARAFLRSITIYEDDDVLVLNKPHGLAVQGGSGLTVHLDGMLRALTDRKGQMPRLVHRLDRDTSGVVLVAKNRRTAAAFGEMFKTRETDKTYWALCYGVPRKAEGYLSTFLIKEKNEEGDDVMRIAKHGEKGAQHAVTEYRLIDKAAQKLSWLELKPITGRTHQLRVHLQHLGHPIIGDPKYFNIENWEFPGGLQNKLHLHARRLVIEHPATGKKIDITAPLPPHMQQSWNLLGLKA